MASNTAPKQYHPDALPLQAIYLGAAVVTGAGEGGELRLEVGGGCGESQLVVRCP